MFKRRFGLRAKSLLGLVLACLLALVPAVVVGGLLLDKVRSHFGEAYARNLTLLKAQAILAPISRDLALSMRFADSEVVRQWLLDEADPAKRALFFREAEGYRRDFRGQGYFLISARSLNYYLNDRDNPYSEEPRYTLARGKPSDGWFFSALSTPAPFNINVNPDLELGVTRVWLNVPVRDGERRLGLAGTGLDLSEFLADFIARRAPGVTPIILDAGGAIQAHPDASLISFGSTTGRRADARTLADLLPRPDQRQSLAAALAEARGRPGEVVSLRAGLDGREQLLAMTFLPELQWFTVMAVDLRAAQVLGQGWGQAALFGVAALLALLLAGFGYAVERLVLRPLRAVQRSATAIADGNYQVSLPDAGRDEIGDLARAFGVMAERVRRHTEELEARVAERTAELEQRNREMAQAHKQINDSIDYASLIQRAFLPDQDLRQILADGHFVLWRPRDVVGGDFYVFRSEAERLLLGVVDCAGHGVPGALMTMLARSAIDQAVAEVGLESPAALLAHSDQALRRLLDHRELPRAIATNMDVGLVVVDRAAGRLRFAGAKVSLYWSDGERVGELKGHRRALVDRRPGDYTDTELALRPGCTYYLTTDGYLDQAGGEHGFGLGNGRFAELLRDHARRPMAEQARALDEALEAYRGELPQRDDVTLLSFRFQNKA